MQGFAVLPGEARKRIAASGGEASQATGKGHRFDSREAAAAGRIGGSSLVRQYGTSYMQQIGSRGGQAAAEPPSAAKANAAETPNPAADRLSERPSA
jgi:hypothetical protein